MPGLLVVGGTLATTALVYYVFYGWGVAQTRARRQDALDNADASATDPGLLKKHSTQKSYSTGKYVYPSIRTFYHTHPQADKLPSKPTTLPLLVFIHGLGGSAAQFAPLLTGLVNAAPCLAIDLPGCGMSAFEPRTPDAYRTAALADLVAEVIRQHRDVEKGQQVILIGHSMGCSLAALLASESSPHFEKGVIASFVAICPRAEPLTDSQVKGLKHLRYMPLPLFELFRAYDRRGGVASPSVRRYAGEDADLETKRLQLQFNQQSKSEVFVAMAFGTMPYYVDGEARGGLPGEAIWSGLKVPTFCIAGELDHVCPPANIEVIAKWLGHDRTVLNGHPPANAAIPTAAGEVPAAQRTAEETDSENAPQESVTTEAKSPTEVLEESRPRNGSAIATADSPSSFVLKTTILPAPASHAMLYATSTVRILSGLIQSFVATHIDHRLSLGWQLQHFTTEGKWDVKNLEKWQKIQAVSQPIAHVFRAMKTLREVDETHTPKVFAENWSVEKGVELGVRMVVDISHESPVYDPKGLEQGGIEYHKFPTVSKLPPTVSEVRAFISLVDALREQIKKEDRKGGAVIGVHCHYGFNRTGFFIVSYLVERLGYRLQDAIEEFAEKRAPGIRHEHFINELFVRYTAGLERRPTMEY